MLKDFTGIYLHNHQSQLIFLTLQKFDRAGLIQAAQSLETSLMMIALGRWTTAVIMIANGLEIIVKSTASTPEDVSDLSELTREFVKLKRVSKLFEAKANRLRRLRNTYVHEAVIPEDNSEAILSYLQDGLPVFENFFERAYGLRIVGCIDDGDLSKNLQFAKSISDRFHDSPGFYVSVLVKTISNLFHSMLTPEGMFYGPDKNSSWDAWDKLLESRRTTEDSHQEYDFDHDLVRCPAACDGSLSVAIARDVSKEEFLKNPFSMATCATCGLLVLPNELIQKYVMEPLGTAGLQKFFSSYGYTDTAVSAASAGVKG